MACRPSFMPYSVGDHFGEPQGNDNEVYPEDAKAFRRPTALPQF